MYAATGSRWKAVGLATASGLSEPLGALLALLLVKPFLTEVGQPAAASAPGQTGQSPACQSPAREGRCCGSH